MGRICKVCNQNLSYNCIQTHPTTLITLIRISILLICFFSFKAICASLTSFIELENKKHNSSLIKIDSNILSMDQQNKLIKLCEFDVKTEFKLLYRASRDGFSSTQFNSKCNNISKTLTIIKVKDKPHIFGGYTEATWEGEEYKEDPNAFIFSLVNDDNEPIKMKLYKNTKNSIWCHPLFGPTFGAGNDFYISSDSDTIANSYSDLGFTYQHPNYKEMSNKAQSFLAGSYYFSTTEIEVFQVI
jgi:hypothetical protein